MSKKFIKIEWEEALLGREVSILTNQSAKQRGFEVGMVYKGKLRDKRDWQVGCAVFECEVGSLGVSYECDLVEEKE